LFVRETSDKYPSFTWLCLNLFLLTFGKHLPPIAITKLRIIAYFDGNADCQGDVVWLDPRGKNAYGSQPVNVDHLFKAYGGYFFENGIELGVVYNWNSSVLCSQAANVCGRHVPTRITIA
jgi:hypothetical protein